MFVKYLLIFALGFVVSGLVNELKKPKLKGSFICNQTDPNKEVFRIEFTASVPELIADRYLLLKVVHESDSKHTI